MNNSEFRSLLKSETGKPQDAASTSFARSSVLGSRNRASVPMTPRHVSAGKYAGNFARQIAEQQRETTDEPPPKRMRSSAAPKGTKLPQGYQDRAASRREVTKSDADVEEQYKKLGALRQELEQGHIDQKTFDKLKAKITSDKDGTESQKVKGLDWELLEKTRKGGESTPTSTLPEANVEDELDEVLVKDVTAVDRHRINEEQSGLSTEASAPVEVLSRNDILRKWKQQRSMGLAPSIPPPEPVLGEHFKKVSSERGKQKQRFIETVDGRRREVLLTIDNDGKSKRKVRWLDKEDDSSQANGNPPANAQPLGMEVPEEVLARQRSLLGRQQAEEEDDDIFQGVGSSYDPLAGIESNSEDESPLNAEETSLSKGNSGHETAIKARDYFSTREGQVPEDEPKPTLGADAAILAALKKGAALRDYVADETHQPHVSSLEDAERAETQQKLLEKLRQRDQDDARDLDMGFGDSRYGDEDDEDGPLWDEGKKPGRKRGPKKRKGDNDNVNDVMSVVSGRQKS